jgi:hypothetical protein
MSSTIDLIYDAAIADISKQKNRLEQLISELETENPEIYSFAKRVLSWYFDKSKRQLLWETFNKVIDLNPLLFMGSFRGFIENELLDDSAFRVEYRVPFKNGYDLVWEDDGLKTHLSTKEDINSFPIVIRDNDGVQDVALLMEAMDKAEFLQEQRIKFDKELSE